MEQNCGEFRQNVRCLDLYQFLVTSLDHTKSCSMGVPWLDFWVVFQKSPKRYRILELLITCHPNLWKHHNVTMLKYVLTFVHQYIYIYVCVCMYIVHIYIYIYVCVYIYICVCIYMCVYIYICIIYICTHMFAYQLNPWVPFHSCCQVQLLCVSATWTSHGSDAAPAPRARHAMASQTGRCHGASMAVTEMGHGVSQLADGLYIYTCVYVCKYIYILSSIIVILT